MSGYYPESYLRKRQREQGVRRMIVAVVALAVIVLVGIPVSIFASRHFAAMRSDAKDGPALAREKQELEQQRKIDSTPDQQWAAAAAGGDSDASKAPRLGDLQYAASFPQLNVGLEGTAPVTGNAASDGAEEVQTLEEPALEALPADNAAVDPVPVTALQPGASPAGPGPGNSPAGGAGSADDKYTRKPENEQKNQDRARSEAKEKAEREKEKELARKKEAERLKREAREKQNARDKAAAREKAEQDKADKLEKPKGGDSVILVVYAGSFKNEEDAKSAKKSLDGLGLSGSLISDEAGFRIQIMSTEDYKAANAVLNKLKSSGFGAAYMTRKRK